MNSKKKTIFSIFVIIMGLFSNLFLSIPAIAATDYGQQFITQAELQDEHGVPQDHFGLHATMVAHYEFEIPDNVAIHAGDSMTVTLPPELTISGSLGFEVKDSAGNVIGNATVDKQTGQVTIVFTDYYETHPNEKKGSFNVFTQWDKGEVTINEDVDVDLGTGGTTIHIDDDNGIATDEKLAKWGWVDDNDPTLIHWVVRVNYEGNEVKNAVYTDYIGSNQVLVSGTVAVTLGHYDATDNFIWEADLDASKITEGTGGTTFTVNYGDLQKSSVIYYDTRATDGGASSQYENSGKLTGSNIQEVTVNEFTPQTGGNGNGSGSNQSAVLTKKDDQTGLVLQGAVFQVIDQKTGAVIKGNLTTDANGQVKIEGLATGNYAFVETQAPVGYELDATPQPFEIVANQQAAVQLEMTNKEKPSLGSVELTKQDATTKQVLAGAQFKLLGSDGKEIATALETNQQGKLVIDNLAPGDYQLIETKAPTGYQLDTTPILFTIEKNQTVAKQVTMTNELILGSVELTKMDKQSGKTLQGAVFQLTDATGKVLQSGLTTNSQGKLTINDLTPGDYQLIETQAPANYQLDTTPLPFTIEKGQTVAKQVTMTNELILGSVELTKTDKQSGKTLQGAVFQLTDSQGTVLKSGLTTNDQGKLVINDLAPGDYQLHETKAPTGYRLDKTPVTFTIEKGQTVIKQVTMTNLALPGSVILTKTDAANGTKLAGAVFKLLDKQGQLIKEKLTTGVDGRLALSDLQPGDYQLVETQAPAGYQLDKTPISFTIHQGQIQAEQVTMTNQQIPGSVVLTKTDAQTNEKLQGAVFQLEDTNGQVLQTNLKTAANGELVLTNLTSGNYQLVETQAPTGYQLDQTPVKFTIEKNQTKVVTLTKTNTKIPGALLLKKIDEKSGELLKGAVFELRDAAGHLLKEKIVTGEDGKAILTDLAPGDYQLIEVSAPTGYELDATPVVFTIDKDQVTPAEATKTNHKKAGTIKKQLPNTGEKRNNWYLIVGLAVLVIAPIIGYKLKDRKPKRG